MPNSSAYFHLKLGDTSSSISSLKSSAIPAFYEKNKVQFLKAKSKKLADLSVATQKRCKGIFVPFRGIKTPESSK
jgi:hypothetical protein